LLGPGPTDEISDDDDHDESGKNGTNDYGNDRAQVLLIRRAVVRCGSEVAPS